MAKEKHDYPIVLSVSDVQEIMGCGKTSAYEMVKVASAYMKKQGKTPPQETVRRAIIPRDVFFEMYGI